MSIKLKNGMSANEIDLEISKGYSKNDSDIIIKHLIKDNNSSSWIEENDEISYNNSLSCVEEVLDLREVIEKKKYPETEGVKCLR